MKLNQRGQMTGPQLVPVMWSCMIVGGLVGHEIALQIGAPTTHMFLAGVVAAGMGPVAAVKGLSAITDWHSANGEV